MGDLGIGGGFPDQQRRLWYTVVALCHLADSLRRHDEVRCQGSQLHGEMGAEG